MVSGLSTDFLAGVVRMVMCMTVVMFVRMHMMMPVVVMMSMRVVVGME